MNSALLAAGQLNFAYRGFSEERTRRLAISIAERMGWQTMAMDVSQQFPVAALDNRLPLAAHKHPQAVKRSEVHDGTQLLGDVYGAGSRDIVNAFADQFLLVVAD
jgi:hypothetical protein